MWWVKPFDCSCGVSWGKLQLAWVEHEQGRDAWRHLLHTQALHSRAVLCINIRWPFSQFTSKITDTFHWFSRDDLKKNWNVNTSKIVRRFSFSGLPLPQSPLLLPKCPRDNKWVRTVSRYFVELQQPKEHNRAGMDSRCPSKGHLVPERSPMRRNQLDCHWRTWTARKSHQNSPNIRYSDVLLKWEFFIKMRAACFAPSFHKKEEHWR